MRRGPGERERQQRRPGCRRLCGFLCRLLCGWRGRCIHVRSGSAPTQETRRPPRRSFQPCLLGARHLLHSPECAATLPSRLQLQSWEIVSCYHASVMLVHPHEHPCALWAFCLSIEVEAMHGQAWTLSRSMRSGSGRPTQPVAAAGLLWPF